MLLTYFGFWLIVDAPDTVIDNLFLRHEPRFSVYQQFFQVLRDYEAVLLEHPPAKPIPLHYYVDDDGSNTPTNAEAHEYGELVFLSNFDDGKSGTFAYKGFPYYITNHTVVLIHVSSRSSSTSQGLVLFNTSSTMRSNITPTSVKEPTTISIRNWRYFEEAVGYGANRNPVLQESPEQLNITNNDSDYLWYTFRTTNQTINSSEDILEVRLYGWDGQYYMYVDGKLLVSSVAENITKNRVFQKDIPQTIRTTDRVLRREEARRDSQQRIDILSVAMGLYNGDVGPASTKGLIYVTIGNSTANVTYNEFTTQWLLRGEEVAVYTDSGSKHVDWKPVSLNAKEYEEASESSLVWFQGTFDIPQEYHSFAGKGQPNQTALVVNLRDGKLQKGVAYVNGFDIGRYWLRAGHCEGTCAPPHHGSHCYIHWKGCGKPTQSLYHIPFEVLRPRNNLLTFFEETRATNECSLDQVKIQVLHHHNHNHHPILV